MRHSVSHHLPPERAKRLVDELLVTYGDEYKDLRADWSDDSTARLAMSVRGHEITGEIRLAPERFDLDLDLPWVYRPFGSVIKRAVDEQARRWLANF